ncbi:enoyl-CoA hydratase/isomerase family protein [Zavarzinia sp. CC-PAN008]|uniref:enoyl-CoA hydratase/isomerase family protein n=1 Tax=Zavarzinia sp. CC-PAN008 TaxID=3243332 RepID=UPI003F744838
MSTASLVAEPEVTFAQDGVAGIVTLNRPKALNALTRDMVLLMAQQLELWAKDDGVKLVVVVGAGDKAFCAGGDIRALHDSGKAGDGYAAAFYADEYRLNTQIKRYPKPYVALVDGICMGGGVGVSVHGTWRVVTEKTLFAMPETGIGLFPDVGGSYFLPRLPGQVGMYLGLTGARLKGPGDLVPIGVGTHFVPSAGLPALRAALAQGGDVEAILRAHAQDPGAETLAPHRAVIDRCFAESSVEAVLVALERDGGDFAKDAAQTIAIKSPTSLKVTFQQIRRGADLSFEDCMRMEYRMTQRIIEGVDFYEGVRAVVIDKDQKPKWNPDRLGAVDDATVDGYFAPIGDRELRLP